MATINGGRAWRRGEGGHLEDHGDERKRAWLDDADGDGGDAGVDRGDAGESVDRQGLTQQFTATGTYSDSTTQNLTGR